MVSSGFGRFWTLNEWDVSGSRTGDLLRERAQGPAGAASILDWVRRS